MARKRAVGPAIRDCRLVELHITIWRPSSTHRFERCKDASCEARYVPLSGDPAFRPTGRPVLLVALKR